MPTARFVALHPTEQALLLGVVEGRRTLRDGRATRATATAIAQDFMLRLADLHGLDAVELGLAAPASRSATTSTASSTKWMR